MVEGTESGDLHFVRESPDGVLLAVIDGVGHGSPAADASRMAAETLASSADEDTVSLVWRCHEALKHTRGAVMTMAFFCLRTATMTWVGVGNVESVWYHTDATGHSRLKYALLRGGVVGHRLPPMRAADRILAGYRKGTDDALVLVVQCVGDGSV
jgi:phosphoserine phosphatase RsbX